MSTDTQGSLRSWTHETPQSRRRYRVFSEFQPRYEELSGGFSAQQLQRNYPSDGHGGHDFIPLLDSFDLLIREHPDVLEQDLALAIQHNQAAAEDPAQCRAALESQYEDQLLALAPGLGAHLGHLFREAILDGDLPKTVQLLSKFRPHGRVAHQGASCNPAKARWAKWSVRPFLRAPEHIHQFDVDGGNAYSGHDGSFPSGHTSEAYWQGVTLATLLPELAAGILARTADLGHYRVLMGVHYPLDVIGGRMMGSYIAANRWSDPLFRELLLESREELCSVLEAAAGADLVTSVEQDQPYMSFGAARDHYRQYLSYGFGQLGPAGVPLEVPEFAPNLLITAYPQLNAEERAQVLRDTALDSGYPLDKQGPDGGWQRIDLLAAMTEH